MRILGDIQGPKFRCSLTVDDVPVPLTRGEVVEFGLAADDTDLTRPGRITLMPTTEQTALVHGVTPGMQLLLDDGFMEVTVKERLSPSAVTVEVVVGGKLKSRKGINVRAPSNSHSSPTPPAVLERCKALGCPRWPSAALDCPQVPSLSDFKDHRYRCLSPPLNLVANHLATLISRDPLALHISPTRRCRSCRSTARR